MRQKKEEKERDRHQRKGRQGGREGEKEEANGIEIDRRRIKTTKSLVGPSNSKRNRSTSPLKTSPNLFGLILKTLNSLNRSGHSSQCLSRAFLITRRSSKSRSNSKGNEEFK